MFLKVVLKESGAAGVSVIRSPFPCIRAFGRGEAKCEDSGKGSVGRNLPRHRKPETQRGNEGKAGQKQTGPETGVSTVGEPNVLL